MYFLRKIYRHVTKKLPVLWQVIHETITFFFRSSEEWFSLMKINPRSFKVFKTDGKNLKRRYLLDIYRLRLYTSQVFRQDGAYSWFQFCSMKRLGVFLPPVPIPRHWMGC